MIIIFSLSDHLGGAQIRYAGLYEELQQRLMHNEYKFVINKRLYTLYRKAGFLNSSVGLITVDDDFLSSNSSSRTKRKNEAAKSVIASKRRVNSTSSFLSLPKKTFVRRFFNGVMEYVRFLTLMYNVHRVFSQTKPKLVYAVWLGGMIAWPLKYVHGFKFIYSYMDSGFSSIEPKWTRPLKNEHLPLLHADKIDFLSKSLVEGVRKRVKISDGQVAVTPNSFKNYDKYFPEEGKEQSVVFSARFDKIKNPLLFVEAVSLFNDQFNRSSDITFHMIGDGSELFAIKDLRQKLNIVNLKLHGYLPDPSHFYRRSKVFVSIQQTNNYPSQSLLEAMACENAIIASDVGETRLLIDDKVGELVDLNAQSIASALIHLFKNPENLAQKARLARETVIKNHNVDRFLNYFIPLTSNE